MAKQHLNLQNSESIVVQAAAQIYAAYIASGQVAEGEQDRWMKQAIREALKIARGVDDATISDNETV